MCALCTATYPTISLLFFFFNDPPTTEIYTLSLHDALPIYHFGQRGLREAGEDRELAVRQRDDRQHERSEEHTSELQSRFDLVCRLLLEKKKKNPNLTRLSLILTTFPLIVQHRTSTQLPIPC